MIPATLKIRNSPAYAALLGKVKKTLLDGQQRIEAAKVETYWQTGKHIHEHILRHASRADHYGQQVIEKLAEDLEVSKSVLWRCVQFSQSFKILASWRESLPKGLAWSHFRELIKVPDENMRVSLMRRAVKSRWSAEALAQKIRQEVKDPARGNGEPAKLSYAKLIPRRGELYTYRLIELDPLHKDSDDGNLRIDLGFKAHQQLPDSARNFKAGQIIESIKNKNGDYEVRASKRGEEDLFTFQARVERVVDGDTLYVDVDQGFKTGVFQYLRLRGIDAPEIDTPEGKKAKAFVERALAKVPRIILTSSRSDKWDRYLADVWIPVASDQSLATSDQPPATEKDLYLNQLLLNTGHAVRMIE